MSPRRRRPPSSQLIFLSQSLLEAATGVKDFAPTQIAGATALFGHLAVALGVGDPVDEVRPFGTQWYRYQAAVIRAALDGRARALLGVSDDRAWAPRFEGRRGASVLMPARMVPVLDPNLATEAEFADLPGFGAASAARVVAARLGGPFTTLEEVRKAAKLTPTEWEPVAPRLWIGAPGDPADLVLETGALRALIDGALRGVFRHPALPDGAGPATTAMATVEFLAGELIGQRTIPPYWVPSPARMRLGLAAVTRDTRAPAGEPRMAHPAAGVALLRNSTYQRVLEEVLGNAATQVRVTMFFLAVNKENKGPASDLVAALSAAKTRGAEVRVLIADTLPNDVRGADRVNEYAYRALRQAGIPFRRFWAEAALHEKAVLVDRRHVLVGSHNWTASSFFRYDETSVYADSPPLAAQLERRFDDRWSLLADSAARRRAPVGALELLRRTVAEALRDLNYDTTDDLPTRTAELETLAAAVGTTASRLALVRKVGAVMRAVRVAEVTAATLVMAGLDTGAKVKRASRATLRAIFKKPPRLPEPIRGCSVNSAVADRLAELR